MTLLTSYIDISALDNPQKLFFNLTNDHSSVLNSVYFFFLLPFILMTVLFTISCWILREIFSFICFQDTALPWFSFFVVFLLCITYYFLSKTSEPFLRVQVRRTTVPFGTQQFFQAEIYWPLTGLLKTTIYSLRHLYISQKLPPSIDLSQILPVKRTHVRSGKRKSHYSLGVAGGRCQIHSRFGAQQLLLENHLLYCCSPRHMTEAFSKMFDNCGSFRVSFWDPEGLQCLLPWSSSRSFPDFPRWLPWHSLLQFLLSFM